MFESLFVVAGPLLAYASEMLLVWLPSLLGSLAFTFASLVFLAEVTQYFASTLSPLSLIHI